ncbi:XRE family transcriptional regulator [Fervidibacillus halotolerans]|uniref:Helix-turn-helix domain-containing protein n=1 Tax=Fervidibacillus halotolerans TaxID=2980027 RepID=A0A9E8M1X2_9BACI|nr:XRE family transcriptional regulator [Fervidibacillus halotolerans]WAA12774.1 helix-turn-helix domain-containing protein [Fervidibacillus halotolerans]
MIGKKIKRLRIEKGLSLNELASLANVSKSYISYIERGIQTSPSPHILSKIAKILDVSLDEIMYPSDDKGNTDIEWVELLNEGIRAGMRKEEFRMYIDFMKYKQMKNR